ncbi:MAG: insulinase family protein [Lachnospiraceae bacterium]|nr:insulinase family protein [Lachnospiraceae bacterium]
MSLKDLKAYEWIYTKDVKELGGKASLLRHRKTGARVFVVENDDDNKVFCISFRTPPEDSTGVAHIIEHTVLCGSEKYPLRDPFMELVKGSLNTFVNAMTDSDKTMYPVASCNDQDFKNLMDVYLDAVFHPNIYVSRDSFLQEGWHYEMESPEDELSINGVVYNEMKGALSTPDELLDAYIQQTMFPHTAYGVQSGGEPEHIPELTYEAFLDFHRRYYHPSNSFLYLYGDMDAAERLAYIDSAYLSAYDALEIDSRLTEEPPFAAPAERVIPYPVLEDEPTEGAAYLSWQAVFGRSDDVLLNTAMQILEQVLLMAPGAPVRRALYDAGIGTDIGGGLDGGLQTYFSVIARETDLDRKDEFVRIVRETLEKEAEQGIRKSALRAALNMMEFSAREADVSYPKGLLYMLQSMDTWLFDGDPLLPLCYEDIFAQLREKIDTDYFETLIREKFLDNPFRAVVALAPEPGLQKAKDEALRASLAEKKAAMSPGEIAAVVEQTAHLRVYQETPDPPEVLEKIPMLRREDLRKTARPLVNRMAAAGETPVLLHEIDTRGIRYLTVLFDMGDLSPEEIACASLLSRTLGYVDTASHDYQSLREYAEENTGGFSLFAENYLKRGTRDTYTAKFGMRVRVLADKVPFAFGLFREVLLTSDFSDADRIAEILMEQRARMKSQITAYPHTAAAGRAGSYQSQTAAFSDAVDGIGFLRYLEAAEKRMEEDPKAVPADLSAVLGKLLTRARFMGDVTAETAGAEETLPLFAAFAADLPEGSAPGAMTAFPMEQKNEGFLFPSGVQYVASFGNFRKDGLEYTGALRAVRTVLDYEYLWKELREKGGAYGCGVSIGQSGNVVFHSYRDPHLARTLGVYQGAADWLEKFDASERDMTKYIIGTVSTLDRPLTPSASGIRSLNAWLSGVRQEVLDRELAEVLVCTPETIRSLAGHVRSAMKDGSICVLGGEEKIREDEALLKSVRPLVGGEDEK